MEGAGVGVGGAVGAVGFQEGIQVVAEAGTVPDGPTTVGAGGAPCEVHVRVATDETFPAASVVCTEKVWGPSVSPVCTAHALQEAKPPASRAQS